MRYAFDKEAGLLHPEECLPVCTQQLMKFWSIQTSIPAPCVRVPIRAITKVLVGDFQIVGYHPCPPAVGGGIVCVTTFHFVERHDPGPGIHRRSFASPSNSSLSILSPIGDSARRRVNTAHRPAVGLESAPPRCPWYCVKSRARAAVSLFHLEP